MPGPNPAITLPGAFVAIVHISNRFDRTFKWRNTWDIGSTPPAVPAPGDAIIDGLIQFHLLNLTDNCTVDEVELRPWSYGNVPFSQQGALWRRLVGQQGKKQDPAGYNGNGNAEMGGEVCALVQRVPTDTGRLGHMFLRGLLEDKDIAAFAGGKWNYVGGSNVTSAKFDGIVTLTLSTFLAPAAQPFLGIVRHSIKTAPNAPSLTRLSTLKLAPVVAINKQTRKNKQ